MKKFIINCLLSFIPSSKWRKIVRHKVIGEPLPFEWHEYRRRMFYGDKHVYIGQDGVDVINNELAKDKPSLICRYGTIELGIMTQFLKNNKRKIHFENTEAMYTNAGFFPITDYMLSRFAGELVEITKEIDVLGVRHLDDEFEAFKKCSSNIKIIDLGSIDCVIFDKPWTRFLKDKKVLVVHPFAQTIKSQYEKRELLFKNHDILPDFDLKVIKSIQSIADEKQNLPFKTWFEALDYMKEQILATDFDIALIGAGAYGMFLAHYCKTLGKKAVHMGGATQLLFGIKGKRWDDAGFYNEHWVRPSENEIPKGANKVECGCYW